MQQWTYHFLGNTMIAGVFFSWRCERILVELTDFEKDNRITDGNPGHNSDGISQVQRWRISHRYLHQRPVRRGGTQSPTCRSRGVASHRHNEKKMWQDLSRGAVSWDFSCKNVGKLVRHLLCLVGFALSVGSVRKDSTKRKCLSSKPIPLQEETLYLEIDHVGGLEGLSIALIFSLQQKMFVEPTPASISHQESLVLVGFKRRNFGIHLKSLGMWFLLVTVIQCWLFLP